MFIYISWLQKYKKIENDKKRVEDFFDLLMH